MINLQRAVQLLSDNDNFLILSHVSPDGDTMGSAFALCYALRNLGKTAKVNIPDGVPTKFEYLARDYHLQPESADHSFIVSVDVATKNLLEEDIAKLDINLAIDHHPSNSLFANETLLEDSSAANAEIIYNVIAELKAEITPAIADCIYTALATDTGCFRFANTTPRTHMIASKMLEAGANNVVINKTLFDTKTKEQVKIEQLAMESMEYYCDGKIAVIAITDEMVKEANSKPDDLDNVANIPRSIEGVQVGVTLKQKGDNFFKISTRSSDVDVSKVCATFGGGGHKRASGCKISDSLDNCKKMLVDEIAKHL